MNSIPADDLKRDLRVAKSDSATHIGVVGDNYTILLSGKETAGRYCLIDMYVPPGGGPPPHRHDFEESFTVLEGEIELVFRGKRSTAGAGETVNIPANSPHQFHNKSERAARLLCLCAPAGQEEFFLEIGVPLATRTAAPPKPDPAVQEAFKVKTQALAPKYRTEILEKA